MKIVALLPVKNELWVLRACLKSLSLFADEIIILDDNSDDDYKDLLSEFSKLVIIRDDGSCGNIVNMSAKRKRLLDAGRQRRGTHFIWLDADEVFSDNFFGNHVKYINGMIPGQKIMMKWVFLADGDRYIQKGAFSNIYKDFIVFDDESLEFEDKKLSENRTPGKNVNPLVVRPEEGVVLHLQNLNKDRNDSKQAWYRCLELIEGKRSARRINNTYSITINSQNHKNALIPEMFKSNFLSDVDARLSNNDWHIHKIIEFFDKYGIEFFEPLQIWDIKKLHNEFITRVGREPVSKVFPKWLIILNNLKNYFINKINS